MVCFGFVTQPSIIRFNCFKYQKKSMKEKSDIEPRLYSFTWMNYRERKRKKRKKESTRKIETKIKDKKIFEKRKIKETGKKIQREEKEKNY